MVKVLAIVPSPRVFGLQIATLAFFRRFDPQKISPMFLVSHWNDGSFIKRLEESGLAYDVSYLGLISKQMRWSSIKMTAACLAHIPQLFFDLWRLMNRHRFDVIYVSGYHILIQIFPMLVLWRKPVVCHVHDYYLDTPFHKRLYRLLDRRITSYVVVSEAIRFRLESLGIAPEKIERIYNGIDASRFDRESKDIFHERYGWSTEIRLVAFVGQIGPHKGPLDFVEAARVVCEQRGDVRMLLIGEAAGEHFEEVRQRVAELGLQDRIVFCGFEDNAADLFTSIDILVVPSQREDPAPLVAVEAMAAGKPVIVTRSGGLPELVEHGQQGFVVERRDVKGIADAIIKLLNDPGLAEGMGKSGRRRVEKYFSIDRQAKLLELCLLSADGEATSRVNAVTEVSAD